MVDRFWPKPDMDVAPDGPFVRYSDFEALASQLRKLLTTAKMLLSNAEGCAMNHYGDDYAIHGAPGWLTDCQADIERAQAVLAKEDARHG